MKNATAQKIVTFRVGSIIKIDGQQAYWFSPSRKIAWNSTAEWSLTNEQVVQLIAEVPSRNADTAKGTQNWQSDRRYGFVE